MTIRKIQSIILLASVLFTGCNTPGEHTSPEAEAGFSFAFLTDIHVQPEDRAAEGFLQAIDTVNKLKPDFVITGGDLVMDALNTGYGRADSLYELYAELSSRLNMPVYNTVGNHEVYGWHSDEAGIEGHPDYGKSMYEKRIGKRFYSFDHKNWHFIVLDAIGRGEDGHYIGKVDKEQIAWLKEDMEAVDPLTPIAVSVHIPFITSSTQLMKGSTASNAESIVITNSSEVLGLFREHNLRLVLQGHLHYLEDIFVQNQIHFITGGAVCARWWKNKPGAPLQEGFVLLKLNGEDVDWEYVDIGWTTPYE